MLVSVFVLATVGYVILGFSVLDAVYQTVTTVATVGFREVQPLGNVGKVFTIILILVGVGTALYTFSVVLETLFEGDRGLQFRLEEVLVPAGSSTAGKSIRDAHPA